MKRLLALVLALTLVCSMFTAVSAESVTATFIYVAENGDDAATGTAVAPLKTISAAVKKAEGIDGTVVINLKGGTYQMTETIALTEKNSDLVIRAYGNEDVMITGGTVLPYSAFKKCTDEAFINALSDKSVKDKIVSANLKDLGITDFGEIKPNGMAANGDWLGYAPTLTYNEKALTIARYPNDGYLYTASVIDDGAENEIIENSNNMVKVEYTISDSRLKNWSWKDVWNTAYFMHDWADTTMKAEYNAETNSISSATTKSYLIAANRRVYFFNVPEEIDIPGEWYLDRETGILYMIPVEGMGAGSELVFTSYNKDFFDLSGAKNISFIGIKFNGTRAKAINAENCDTININDCEFTGIGDTAVYAKSCYRVNVENSYFHDLGSMGVYLLNCGDKEKLISGECKVINCHFERFSQYNRTYAPAIYPQDDVGTLISNCEIHDAPHIGIIFRSNDTIIEYCDVYDVCQDTADTGAIYTGRRWETRGNEIRYNYIHDMTKVETTTGMEKMGVYLDDCSAGTRVHGNVFFKVDSVALIGGGRHNQFTNNIMVNCEKPLVFDERGLTWSLAQQTAAIEKVPYKEGVWAEKYPELVNIMEDDPGYPKYNVLKNNVLYQTPEFNIYPAVKQYSTIENNLKMSATKDFVDFRNQNFALNADSEIFTKLPEFENIPFDKIGRYDYTVEDKYVEAGSAPSAPADDTIKVMLNGAAIDFADVAPQIINDRTMVPLRAIFEALGAEVAWDDATKTVVAVKGEVTIKMTIGASTFTRNNESIALDSPATIVDSRTLVPVRAIAESFGSEVDWDGTTKTVTITD